MLIRSSPTGPEVLSMYLTERVGRSGVRCNATWEWSFHTLFVHRLYFWKQDLNVLHNIVSLQAVGSSKVE